MQSAQDVTRVGVVGIGKMGLLHASILSVIPNVQVVALCDNNESIVKYARKLNEKISVVTEIEELCKLGLDAIYVTTPIPTHFEIIKSVLSSDKNCAIFSEKTLANNFKDSQELARLVRTRQAPCMVGYHKKFAVTFSKARSLLEEGALGEIDSFEAYAYSEDFLNATNTKTGSSRGGLLKDLGSHSIDLALCYFGELSVESLGRSDSGDNKKSDHLNFLVHTTDGKEGRFDISWSAQGFHKPEVGLKIKGQKGILEVNDDKLLLKLENGEESRWSRHNLNDNVPFLLAEPEYFREDEHFIRSLREGQRTPSDFESASKVDRVISEVEGKAG